MIILYTAALFPVELTAYTLQYADITNYVLANIKWLIR